MIHKTGMTIDAYLRNAGIESDRTMRRKNFIPLKAHPGSSFSNRLSSAISSNSSSSIKNKTGLTISDYLNPAATGVSTCFFKNATIRNGSFPPAGLDMLSHAFRPTKTDRITADSAFHGSSIGADAGDKTPPDSEMQNVEIADSIKGAARKYNLPEKLIKSVIQAESNFQADAVSPAGAKGLMQLMPATAKELGVDDPFDVRQNIDGGAGYLRRMLDRFGQDVQLALAAYNAGPGTVEKYNGNVPYRVTQTYIERVLKGASA
jgi:hypothetical protein